MLPRVVGGLGPFLGRSPRSLAARHARVGLLAAQLEHNVSLCFWRSLFRYRVSCAILHDTRRAEPPGAWLGKLVNRRVPPFHSIVRLRRDAKRPFSNGVNVTALGPALCTWPGDLPRANSGAPGRCEGRSCDDKSLDHVPMTDCRAMQFVRPSEDRAGCRPRPSSSPAPPCSRVRARVCTGSPRSRGGAPRYQLSPTSRTLGDETCGILVAPAERSGSSLVCRNPRISWTRAP